MIFCACAVSIRLLVLIAYYSCMVQYQAGLADVSENGILHCSSVLLRFSSIIDCYLRDSLKGLF